ncbi:uncharacterized protein [Thunnus thynnus]|uniref:uncharacterized protein n=1 Tax=Thunnus thynnus TaxID=8237 RepID=UPI0035298107
MDPLLLWGDRCILNTLTGALTITGLTPDDSGSYTVEINNKVTSKTQLLVISPVSKPTISLSCESEMTYCVLTCSERSTTSPDVPETSTQDLETAESPDPSNETETNDQRKPCRNYNEGGCWKGDSCHYRHVCEFALKGNCPNGSNCRLKHPGGTKPQWQFEGDNGTWYEFIYKRGTTECSVNSDEIERKYQKNPKSKMPFTVNRNYYELDFEG